MLPVQCEYEDPADVTACAQLGSFRTHDVTTPGFVEQGWDQVNLKALENWATEDGKPTLNAVAVATKCHIKRIPVEGFG